MGRPETCFSRLSFHGSHVGSLVTHCRVRRYVFLPSNSHGSRGGGLVTYCRVRKLVQRRCRFSACRRPKRNLKNPVALMGSAYLHRGRGRKKLIQGRFRFAACRRPKAQPEKSCCVDGLCLSPQRPREKEPGPSRGPSHSLQVPVLSGTSFGSATPLEVASGEKK